MASLFRIVIVAFFLFSFVGLGCDSISKSDEPAFLGFRLGMTNEQCDQLRDSLYRDEILYYRSEGGSVYHFVIPEIGKASSIVYLSQHKNMLLGTSIHFGSYDEWNEVVIDRLVSSENLDYIFDLYKRKYGRPKFTSKEDSTYTWTIGNTLLEFSFGKSVLKEVEHIWSGEDGEVKREFKATRFYEHANINYEFVDSYLKRMESENLQNAI